MSTSLDAARAYLDKLPPAISGAGGHAATFAAACWTVRFGLSDADALALLAGYNRRCQPPWTEKELAHKLRDARRVAGGQVCALCPPRPAVRVVWKLEKKTVVAVAPPTAQVPRTPAQNGPPGLAQAGPDSAASLPPDQDAWLPVARQVLDGEFDGADKSTVESIAIGLRSIQHPDSLRALDRLKTTRQ
jgi:hypothetical protein